MTSSYEGQLVSSLKFVRFFVNSVDFKGSCVKRGLTGLTTRTVRDICTFAVFLSVSRPFYRFTEVYEGHFVLCCKEKLKPLDRAMANF